MKKRISAGLLMYRLKDNEPEMLLAHPGGPFFQKKDEGHWSIPKGEPNDNEDLLDTAMREFKEETGITPPDNKNLYIELGSIVQKGGKTVYGWAFPGVYVNDPDFKCNEFEMEWPPHSGKKMNFPEIDRIEFFDVNEAMKKIKGPQGEFVKRLLEHLKQ